MLLAVYILLHDVATMIANTSATMVVVAEITAALVAAAGVAISVVVAYNLL